MLAGPCSRQAGAGLRRFVCAVLLAGHVGGCLAAQLQGQVIRVADGDTLVLLDAQQQQHTVRLAGIDAPEKSQAFGQASKNHLAQLVQDQAVTVVYDKRDKYGRIVGKVMVQDVDANWVQLQAGWAWHYKQYQGEQSPQDRDLYRETEAMARQAQRGLWQGDTAPEPPWAYRARLSQRPRAVP